MPVPKFDVRIDGQGGELLTAEREKASFDTEAMAVLLAKGNGDSARGKRVLESKAKIGELIKNDATLQRLRDAQPFEGLTERVENGLIKSRRIQELFQENPWLRRELAQNTPYAMDYSMVPLDTPISVTANGMFTDVINSQGTEEQKKKWLQLARARRIQGTYAQTELGHGSNVRGLETTATYDPETKTFDLHSPTITATKWWPANLGHFCTHAVVYARLITPNGVDNGVNTFFVQLRDMQDHKPLPGVHLGASGPTMGQYANEHGRCRFEHVKLPLENMFARWQHVTPEGEFVRHTKEVRANYTTMTNMRVGFAKMCHNQLGKACTIAARYSCVRRQGFPAEGVAEPAILDYQQQQQTILPAIAIAYGFEFASRRITLQGRELREQIKAGNLEGDVLGDLHRVTSGLKAVATELTVDTIEAVRRACGGHGYNMYSGIPTVLFPTLRMFTVEGDNNLLLQQVARELVKEVRAGTQKSIPYLNASPGPCLVTKPEDWLDPQVQLTAYDQMAAEAIKDVAAAVEADVAGGMPQYQATNTHMVNLTDAAKLHCTRGFVDSFIGACREDGGGVFNTPEEKTLLPVVKRLCDLMALSLLERRYGFNFLKCGWATKDQVRMLSQAARGLLRDLRPDAVALVDAMKFDDLELGQSALGAYDGRVYERLWEWTEKDPLNNYPDNVIPAVYENYLPILKGEIGDPENLKVKHPGTSKL